MDKSSHIVICSTSFFEYDRRLQRIAKALIAAGFKITWISRKKNTGHLAALDNIEHLIIRTKFKSGPLFYLEYNLRLYRALRKMAKPIINAIDLDTIPACCLAQKPTQQLVFDAHEIYYEVPELTDKPLKKTIWKMVAKHFLPKTQTNYTVNNSLKEHYENKYGTTYEVIRNVPLAYKGPQKLKSNNKTLVYLGVLNAGRGLELAIEAMDSLPEYKLILVGDGDIYDKLKWMAKGKANIAFRGFVEPSELSQILNSAAIGLNMLVADSLNYKLSLANKFFDYMHAGLPSINMAYPEYQSIIGEHRVGLLVNEYNSAAMISAVKSLEDEVIYSEFSSRAFEASEEYNWESEQIKLIEIYKNLLAKDV